MARRVGGLAAPSHAALSTIAHAPLDDESAEPITLLRGTVTLYPGSRAEFVSRVANLLSFDQTRRRVNATAPTPRDDFFKAIYEVQKGSIDRVRSGAEFVEKAAAGILAVYSAVLGVVFSVSDKAPLPVRGLIPAIFLALALVLAAFFLALPKGIVKVGTPADTVTDPVSGSKTSRCLSPRSSTSDPTT